MTVKHKNNSTASEISDADRKRLRIGAVLVVLVIAATLRLIYADGLPLNLDESTHKELAAACSLRPATFNLPLGSRQTNHPLLTVYVIALGMWAGDGSVFFVRLVFVLFSLFGLVGLFYLTRMLFGFRAGLLALAIAAVDRHLITYAPVMLEPVFLCLVPWTLLAMHKALETQHKRYWLFLGLIFGVGYQFSELFMVLVAPFGVCVVLRGRIRQVLKNPAMYIAAGIFLLCISPTLIWNLANDANNYERTLEKVGTFGLTPRILLLYIGDLLICFKSTTWMMLEFCHELYPPWNIPCHWVAGLVYLACFSYSLRFFRYQQYTLLLLTALGVAIVVSVLDRHEAWNEYGWGSMTLFAVFPLVANMADKIMMKNHLGKGIVSVLLCGFTVFAVQFLSGPKWGYMCPNWEKAYYGKVFYYMSDYGGKDFAEAGRLTELALRNHPDSVIVHLFRAKLAKNMPKRIEAYRAAMDLDAQNPALILEQAQDLANMGDLKNACRLVRELLAKGKANRHWLIHKNLAEYEFLSGNYPEAGEQAKLALELKPDEYELYKTLFFGHDAAGRTDVADAALARYAAMCYDEPYKAYLNVAFHFAESENLAKALACCNKALKLTPECVEGFYNRGIVYAKKGDIDLALRDWERVIEIDPAGELARQARTHLQHVNPKNRRN